MVRFAFHLNSRGSGSYYRNGLFILARAVTPVGDSVSNLKIDSVEATVSKDHGELEKRVLTTSQDTEEATIGRQADDAATGNVTDKRGVDVSGAFIGMDDDDDQDETDWEEVLKDLVGLLRLRSDGREKKSLKMELEFEDSQLLFELIETADRVGVSLRGRKSEVEISATDGEAVGNPTDIVSSEKGSVPLKARILGKQLCDSVSACLEANPHLKEALMKFVKQREQRMNEIFQSLTLAPISETSDATPEDLPTAESASSGSKPKATSPALKT